MVIWNPGKYSLIVFPLLFVPKVESCAMKIALACAVKRLLKKNAV